MNSYETRRLFCNLYRLRKHCQDGHTCVSGLKHTLSGPELFSSGNQVGLNRESRQVLFKAFRTMTFSNLFFLWRTSPVQLCCSTMSDVLPTTIQALEKYEWGSFLFFPLMYPSIKLVGFSFCMFQVFLNLETNYSFLFSSQFLFLQKPSTQNRSS